EDFIGKPILQFVHPDNRDHARERIQKMQVEGKNVPFEEERLLARDGRIVYAEIAGTHIMYHNRPAIMTVVRDITERKQAEESLKRYAEGLKRSNEALERFAYVSSHDLQEPLRTIVCFSQLLEKRYHGQLGKDADEYIDFIVRAGRRMQTLIYDLLEYSRITTRGSEFRAVDTEAALEDVLSDMTVDIERTRATVTHDPLRRVMADPVQLCQVLQNLISNALKFRREDEPPRVHISAERTGRMVQFSVQDNGIGIEPEYFQKIFIVFQRLHAADKYPGTGIGLALVKRIVEQHGGRIWVTSEPGRGSTFSFTLPAVD
ncbi:MAG TPA: ATP-binding protein, partial [Methanomicrobiales archaeon]|nr:ATP-binding protein [Methanomicrobiales archaeon]